VIARIGSSRVAYDDVGRGSAVVFLHAFPLNRVMWAPQTSALAREWRCLTIDTRGFGESPADGPVGVDRYADDVVAVLDAAGVARAVIVGLSMGGYVAFALWRRAPERVRGLVLADTRAGADVPETRKRRLELIELARSQGVAPVVDRQIVGLLGKTTRERRGEIEDSVRSIATNATVEGIVGALRAMLERPDSTPTLPTVSVPTLIIVGDEDVLTPPKEARVMHAAIAGSRLEVLAQAGHVSSMEQPAAFNAALSAFLRGIGEPTRLIRL
jgi:pimeloyl-ACP methyl ester carboxylesterase